MNEVTHADLLAVPARRRRRARSDDVWYGQGGKGFGWGTVHHAAGTLRMPYRPRYDSPFAPTSVVDEDLRVVGTQQPLRLRHVGDAVQLRGESGPHAGRAGAAAVPASRLTGRAVFAVVLTGPPGAGKTVALTALSDALVEDRVLAALGVGDHLLFRLDAARATLLRRITAREPPGWPGLAYLQDETPRLQAALAALDGVHLAIDSEQVAPAGIAERIRSARPDQLRPREPRTPSASPGRTT